MTSHDVVAMVRKKLSTKRVGHAGTLDPMATGVLVVAVEEATKLVPYLTASDKAYEATVTLGVATDTLDADGRATARVPVPMRGDRASTAPLAAERARASHEPPIFSAIHSDGARARARAARRGTGALEARPVHVDALDVLGDGAGRDLRVRLVVSKGYYVRGLARDLAARLGTVGHLTSLRRVRSGPFTLTEAIALASVDGDDRAHVRRRDRRARPSRREAHRRWRRARTRAGRRGSRADVHPHDAGEHAWLAEDGTLVAVGRVEEGAGRVTRGFAG